MRQKNRLLYTEQTQTAQTIIEQYFYNDKNQMVSTTNAESIVTNTFNAECMRVSKTVDGVTTNYAYEYNQIIKEQDTSNSVAYNTYGTNLISRELDSVKVYYNL